MAVEAADADGDAAAGQDSSVDATVTSNLTHASDQQDSADVGDTDQQQASADGAADESGRSASTGEGTGKVTVAAAVGVNVQSSSVSAGVPDGKNITVGGMLTVATSNNTTASVTTDGTAVGDALAAVGIGAAVAVNVVHTNNDATLGNGTTTAGSINISALKFDVAKLMVGDPATAVTDTYLASATSGGGQLKCWSCGIACAESC